MTTLTDMLFEAPGPDSRQQALVVSLGSNRLGLPTILPGGALLPVVEVASAIHRLLDVPVGHVAMNGWNRYREVERARRETRATPGERKVVRLAEHSIKSKQSPTVEASVGPTTTTVLVMDVEIELEVAHVDLVVEGGTVIEAHPGGAVGRGELSAHGVTLAKREYQAIDLKPVVLAPQAAEMSPVI